MYNNTYITTYNQYIDKRGFFISINSTRSTDEGVSYEFS